MAKLVEQSTRTGSGDFSVSAASGALAFSSREARDAALRKRHNEREARMERNLYCYLKREIEKEWKGYAIIAGGVFLGILLFILCFTFIK
jgi:hypothetical protein